MDTLQLKLFGRFEAGFRGRSTDLGGIIERALLCYLAMQRGRAVPLQEINELLFIEDLPEHKDTRLQIALQRLQERLDGLLPGVIAVSPDGETFSIDPDRVELDVVRFETLASSEDRENLETAATLYSDFLVGMTLRRGDFDKWVGRERRRLGLVAVGVFQRLSDLRGQAGDSAGAIEAAERLVVLEPLEEVIVQKLMRSHAELGDKTQAIRIYQSFSRELLDTLGVQPSEETQRLALAIRDGRLTPVDPETKTAGAAARKTAASGDLVGLVVRAGDVHNGALLELADQLQAALRGDLAEDMGGDGPDGLWQRAGLAAVDGILNSNDTDLVLEIGFHAADPAAPPLATDTIVEPFEDVFAAVEAIRRRVCARVAALAVH